MIDFLKFAATLSLTLIIARPPSIYAQGPEKPLPNPADYPQAGAACKKKVKLSPAMTTPAVDWPTKFRCELVIHTCEGRKEWTSNARDQSPEICADYWAVYKELGAREVCCDAPCQEYSGDITCDCDGDGKDETSKTFKSCGIPNQWPKTFHTKCEQWVRSDGTFGYETDYGIQRQASTWLEYTVKCPALKCEQKFKPCKQDADDAYTKCTFKANFLGWRERCLQKAVQATNKCVAEREKCVKGMK